jgi:hypothetical protein
MLAAREKENQESGSLGTVKEVGQKQRAGLNKIVPVSSIAEIIDEKNKVEGKQQTLTTKGTGLTLRDRSEQEKIHNAVQQALNHKKNRFRGETTLIQSLVDTYIINHLPNKFLSLCRSGRSVS